MTDEDTDLIQDLYNQIEEKDREIENLKSDLRQAIVVALSWKHRAEATVKKKRKRGW